MKTNKYINAEAWLEDFAKTMEAAGFERLERDQWPKPSLGPCAALRREGVVIMADMFDDSMPRAYVGDEAEPWVVQRLLDPDKRDAVGLITYDYASPTRTAYACLAWAYRRAARYHAEPDKPNA